MKDMKKSCLKECLGLTCMAEWLGDDVRGRTHEMSQLMEATEKHHRFQER